MCTLVSGPEVTSDHLLLSAILRNSPVHHTHGIKLFKASLQSLTSTRVNISAIVNGNGCMYSSNCLTSPSWMASTAELEGDSIIKRNFTLLLGVDPKETTNIEYTSMNRTERVDSVRK